LSKKQKKKNFLKQLDEKAKKKPEKRERTTTLCSHRIYKTPRRPKSPKRSSRYITPYVERQICNPSTLSSLGTSKVNLILQYYSFFKQIPTTQTLGKPDLMARDS
jgi:hypothetical protein